MKKLHMVLRIAVLLAILSMAFVTSAQDTIAPGDVIEGEAADAVVPFTFDAVAGDSFTFSIEADFTPVLTVQDAAGEVFASSEDLRFTDLPMLFVAPADGTYTLVVGTSFGEPEGAYTLGMNTVDVEPIAYGDSVSLAPEEVVAYYFSFEGAEGDVINVYATSEDDDVQLRVMSTAGVELEEDDDDGPSVDPYIRRFIVPADGSYLIYLTARFADRPMVTPLTMNIEQTELLPVSDELTAIQLGGDVFGNSEVEVFVFDGATAGATYRVAINSGSTDVSLRLEVRQGDDTISSLNVNDFARVTTDFIARGNGRIFVALDSSTFGSDATDFEVALTPVE